MLVRVVFLAGLALFALAGVAMADTEKFLGSSIPMETAVAKADAIFAGRLTSLTSSDPSVPGLFVGKVKFPPGSRVQAWTSDGGMMGALNVTDDGVQVSIPESASSGAFVPQVGAAYIFWVTGNARNDVWTFRVFKIYPSTPENNSRVRHLIKRMGKR